MPRSIWAVLGILVLAPATHAEPDEPPPLWPGSDKRLSVSVDRWMLPVVEKWLPNDGVDRIVRYVERMPGDVKARFMRIHGFPKPTPAEVAAFYDDWAERAGYRLILEIRAGEPPPPDWPESNDRPHLAPSLRVAHDPESYYWANAYHRPSAEGGVFLWVWVNHRIYWVWAEGYIPIGPILGEFLDLPDAPIDMVPPESVTPMEPLSDRGPCAGFFVRVRLGSYEIQRIAADLSRRVEHAAVRGPVEALFAVSPALLAPVRAACSYTYVGRPEERQAWSAEWVDWAEARAWPKLGEGRWGDADGVLWAQPGTAGGAVIVFDIRDTSTVVLLDGGPDLLVLLPVLGDLAEAGGEAAEGPPTLH